MLLFGLPTDHDVVGDDAAVMAGKDLFQLLLKNILSTVESIIQSNVLETALACAKCSEVSRFFVELQHPVSACTIKLRENLITVYLSCDVVEGWYRAIRDDDGLVEVPWIQKQTRRVPSGFSVATLPFTQRVGFITRRMTPKSSIRFSSVASLGSREKAVRRAGRTTG